MSEHQKELDRHFAWFEKQAAAAAGEVRRLGAQAVVDLRPDSARHTADRRRLFSFLPVLGLWMLPLGLLLFAQDVPPLQKPMAQGLGWIERKWLERQRAKLERERAKSAQ